MIMRLGYGVQELERGENKEKREKRKEKEILFYSYKLLAI